MNHHIQCSFMFYFPACLMLHVFFFLHHFMKYITYTANIVTVCIVTGIFIYCASAFQNCNIFSVRSHWMLENALNYFYCWPSWLNSTNMEECLNRNHLKVWIVRIFIHTQTAAYVIVTELTKYRKGDIEGEREKRRDKRQIFSHPHFSKDTRYLWLWSKRM